MKTKGLMAALFVILVWGITFVNTRALLIQFSALEIQVIRFVLGWIALAIFGKGKDLGKVKNWRDEVWFMMMGLFGVAIYQLLENCAIHYTNASNVSILVSMCPLLTAIVARLIFKDRKLSPLFFIGFVIAITGVIMVSMNGVGEFHFNPLGDILAALAMLSWVVYSNIVTAINKKGFAQTFIIRRMFFWALVFTVPLAIFGLTQYGATAMNGSFKVTLDGATNLERFTEVMNYVNLGFLGLLASAACFVLWNKALAIIGTVRCTIGLYILPAITVIFAYLFLDEELTLISAIGSLLILIGVIISGWI